MKSTKTLLIAALATGAMLACGSLRAADTNTPPAGERGPGMKGGRPGLARALDLTAEQKPKVDAIMKGSMEKRRALREDTALTPEDKRAKMKSIQEDTTAQMKAVLTPEQFAKFEKLTRGRRNGPPGAGGPPPADKPPQN